MKVNHILDTKTVEQVLLKSGTITDEVVGELILENRNLCFKLVGLYRMNLIHEIYFQNISICTYNGKKKRKLREQSIKLIELVYIFKDYETLLQSNILDIYDMYSMLDILEEKFKG